ncbi:MAG: AAA family ATPase [Puniceicoccales bacterium]|nr:AAA family ATPase [Puniceicoccales bacterium]
MLCGTPGCGKTTLAEVIANETKSKFIKINAVLSNVSELREILMVSEGIPNRIFCSSSMKFTVLTKLNRTYCCRMWRMPIFG